jgi:cytochrome b pre-mRNA-processing protein 3
VFSGPAQPGFPLALHGTMTYPAAGRNTTARSVAPRATIVLRMFRLFRPRFHSATIDSLYGVIVAQARVPDFYEEFGIADSVDGRFELIVLHLALLTRRLDREAEGAALSRALVDRFGRDMDDNLREMGVGDLAVPKKMKRLFEALYGRTRIYQGALNETGSEALEAALARNVFGGRGGAVARLAAYVRRATHELDATDGGQILAGRLAFPAPRAILADDASTRSAESRPDETT